MSNYEQFADDLEALAHETPGYNHSVLHESLLSRVAYWLKTLNAAKARVAALEDALREIAEETGYASGGNYQPDIARWARDALKQDPTT